MKAGSPPPLQQFTNGRLGLAATGATDVGLHRQRNEDALGLLPEAYQQAAAERGYLFAVADGMGGAEKGDVASRLATEALFAAYYGSPPELPPHAALKAAFEAANDAVYREGLNLEFGMMGTTLVACVILDDAAIVANVGDSRAYLFRGGELRQVTEDHSLVQEQVRGGLLSTEQARRSSQRNIITRAIGHQPSVQDDQYRLSPLQPGDVLLLSTDGLHGLVEDADLLRIGQEPDLRQAAVNLIAAANAEGGYDNITCLLVRIVAVGEGAGTRDAARGAQPTDATGGAAWASQSTAPRGRVTGFARGLPAAARQRAVRLAVLSVVAGATVAAIAAGVVLSPAPSAAPDPTPQVLAGMRVSGRVVLPPGVATVPPGVFIAVEGPAAQRRTVSVDPEGRYLLALPADAPEGGYMLAVRPEQWAVGGDAGAGGRGNSVPRYAVYPPRVVALSRGSNLLDEDLTYQLVDASASPGATPSLAPATLASPAVGDPRTPTAASSPPPLAVPATVPALRP